MSLEHTSEPGNAQVNRMHIERGAVAMGTDGPLGTVEQIVMDENTGELRALVVRGGRTGQNTEEVEISASHVVPGSAVGHQVTLDIGMADIQAHPDLAPPYNPDRYVPVHEEQVLPATEAGRAALFSERPVVTEIGDNAAEVIVPGPGSERLETTEAIAGERPDAAPMQTISTADEQPNLVLRGQRGLTARERELDVPAPPVDVEPPITPAEVAVTAAEVPPAPDTPATDETADTAPSEVSNANPSPDLGTSSAAPDARRAGESDWTAEMSTPDSGEERHEESLYTSEPRMSEAPGDDEETVYTEEEVIIADVDGRPLQAMGDSVWMAVPSAAESEDWQQPDYDWRSYDYESYRPRGNWGILLGAALALIAAVGTILLVRRARSRTASRAQQATATAGQRARDLARTAQRQATAAKQAMPAAMQSAAGTARRVRRTASDLPGRWRWFRRGVRVGAAVAVPLARVSQRWQRGKAQDTVKRQPAVVVTQKPVSDDARASSLAGV